MIGVYHFTYIDCDSNLLPQKCIITDYTSDQWLATKASVLMPSVCRSVEFFDLVDLGLS